MAGKRAFLWIFGLVALILSGCAITPDLHMAALKGDTVKAEVLIGKGFDVNKTTHRDETPLHYAAYSGETEVAKMLLDAGADVNAKSRHQKLTPLHKAALWNRSEVAKLLLDYGAYINEVDQNGETALYKAVYRDHAEMAKLLQERGGFLYVGYWKSSPENENPLRSKYWPPK